ncbi:hypothetical protein C1645_823727 [Glomus cerebriforme]|uniref:Uncharacterized protein n=1 Tax=Glomus cerebriforme TaxID=658196 RepID=A0A397T546_9GLOM|nr:hypothetical protein C1645_823727 [Glomus cerebriforme]
MDAFLDEECKKKASNEIRQRNREKKPRDQDLPGTSALGIDIQKTVYNQSHVTSEVEVLERLPYLSLIYSMDYSDNFGFNSSVPCPICNKDHKSENIKNGIGGRWGYGR